MIDSTWFTCTIGTITLTASSVGISEVSLDEPIQDTYEKSGFSSLLTTTKNQFLEYLDGKRLTFDIPLDWSLINGFQLKVLEITSRIPFGKTLTYGQIAAQLNNPKASRAVGASLARNPLPILIPCHRVIAADGALTGYLGKKGIEIKKTLLTLEGHQIVNEKLD